jgi:hypothetical protein
MMRMFHYEMGSSNLIQADFYMFVVQKFINLINPDSENHFTQDDSEEPQLWRGSKPGIFKLYLSSISHAREIGF